MPDIQPSAEAAGQTDGSRSAMASASKEDDTTLPSNLDGSIKKNTSLIKRLKAGVTVPLNDVLALKLDKYIDEVAVSITEPIYKTSSDISQISLVCSLIHRRYPGFSPMLLTELRKSISPPPVTPPFSSAALTGQTVSQEQRDREESLRLNRQRSSLRLLVELYLVGILEEQPKSKELSIYAILSDLFSKDKSLANLSLAVAFIKYFSIYFFPKQPEALTNVDSDLNQQISSSDAENLALVDELVPPSTRTAVRALLSSYYESVISHLMRDHQRIKRLEKTNTDIFIARGEILEDRQENYEKAAKALEKLRSSAETMSSYLGLEMPDFPEEENVTRMGIGITDTKSTRDERELKLGIWDDEDSKAFYENIVDLQNQVPAILIGVKVVPKPTDQRDDEIKDEATIDDSNTADTETSGVLNEDTQDTVESSKDLGLAAYNAEKEADSAASIRAENDDGAEDKLEATASKAALETVLARLQNAVNRDTIDQLAVEFAFLNNKGSRKHLVQTLVGVSRQRLDLLPYFARMIATLNPYMPDIGSAVLSENIRYIGELTKFRITPSHVAFHCIKVLLDDFTHHNIDLLCSFLETCGKFLFRNPETNVRMSNFLEILQRKKSIQNLESRHTFMIENAIYETNPPEQLATVQKERPPIVMFLRKLIYKDLSKNTAGKTLMLLRKANWADPTIRHTIYKLFTKIWKVKFSNIGVMAYLSSELSRFYPEFGISVVDACLEEIRIAMEINIFKHNQRRVAVVRYLGELFNYKMVDAHVIFETLYLLLRFGHENGIPSPAVACPIDMPTDFFRLRLVCSLLDSCGSNFDRGKSGRSLDDFLSFMQMYIFTKTPMPMDVEFFVSETLELVSPKLKRFKSYAEAVEDVNRIAREQLRTLQSGAASESDDDLDGSRDEMEIDDDGESSIHAMSRHDEDAVESYRNSEDKTVDVDPDNNDLADVDDASIAGDDDDEEELIIHLQAPVHEIEEDLDFEREFSMMMQESLDSRKNERKIASFDAPIPIRSKTATNAASGAGNSASHSGEEPDDDSQVAFTVLTKRGNKQQIKTMALPSDSAFAISTLSKQQEEQAEKSRLKQLVLNYEKREEQSFLQVASTAG
eukprot:jgi/Hompol1/2844/HPOL_003035-RA